MNKGISINELATELNRQAQAKKDYLVTPSNALEIVVETDEQREGKELRLIMDDNKNLGIKENMHQQIATNLQIPSRYYEKMRVDSPELLASNVNHWFNRDNKKRMIRTLDNNARAYLSDRYRRIDNDKIACTILPELLNNPHTEIVSSQVTDKKMYIKCKFNNLQREVKGLQVDDVVNSGIIACNSEIGRGGFSIQPYITRLVCTNGMTAASNLDFGMKRTHLGKKLQFNGIEIFSDETLAADDNALMMQIIDTVRASMNPDIFNSLVDKMDNAAATEELKNPNSAIENLSAQFLLTEQEESNILTNLIQDKDFTQWGILNAVTKIANNQESYERSSELEVIGGKILELNPSQWSTIANAA